MTIRFDEKIAIVTGGAMGIGAATAKKLCELGASVAILDRDVEAATRNFLSGLDVVAVDEHIAERAVSLRRSHRIKLPDAVIWATAQVHAMLLVTRNTKDFPDDDPGIRAPYKL